VVWDGAAVGRTEETAPVGELTGEPLGEPAGEPPLREPNAEAVAMGELMPFSAPFPPQLETVMIIRTVKPMTPRTGFSCFFTGKILYCLGTICREVPGDVSKLRKYFHRQDANYVGHSSLKL
jgi:hypothetical protein